MHITRAYMDYADPCHERPGPSGMCLCLVPAFDTAFPCVCVAVVFVVVLPWCYGPLRVHDDISDKYAHARALTGQLGSNAYAWSAQAHARS